MQPQVICRPTAQSVGEGGAIRDFSKTIMRLTIGRGDPTRCRPTRSGLDLPVCPNGCWQLSGLSAQKIRSSAKSQTNSAHRD